jgi:hypothetical protein
MRRRLLNIASIVCLVTCVALMGMWVRSYRAMDVFSGPITKGQMSLSITSNEGRLSFHRGSIGSQNSSLNMPWSVESYANVSMQRGTRFGFDIDFSLGVFVNIPYWFLVLTTGSLAMIFQLRWPLRFTLRNLFIATTFLAVVLGMSVWLDHS